MNDTVNTTEQTQGYFDPEINAFASATALDAVEGNGEASQQEATVFVAEDSDTVAVPFDA